MIRKILTRRIRLIRTLRLSEIATVSLFEIYNECDNRKRYRKWIGHRRKIWTTNPTIHLSILFCKSNSLNNTKSIIYTSSNIIILELTVLRKQILSQNLQLYAHEQEYQQSRNHKKNGKLTSVFDISRSFSNFSHTYFVKV